MQCPTCDKELDTEQGIRVHHTRVHDVTLPNRVCNGCDTSFYDPKARRKYCDDCNPNAGEHNGNWKDAKETTNCSRCGQRFEYYPSDKDGVYCSDCVASADEFLGDAYVKDAERVEKTCEQCGCSMNVLQSRLDKGNGRFCSQDCVGDWLSENVVGEKHHMWMEGDTVYRGKWWKVRRKARERDDHECRCCGTTATDEGRELDVHHIRPVREFDDPQDAHTLQNVVTLCRSCHRNVEEGNTEVPQRTDEQ